MITKLKNQLKIALTFLLVIFTAIKGWSQNEIAGFTLEDLIILADQKSLAAFQAKNMYLASYWQYRNFKAQNLPGLELSVTPVAYSRSVDVIYSVIDSVNVIMERQFYDNNINLRINQNILKTGGTVFMDSYLGRTETILPESGKQFSSTPIRIGLNQPLFAYNRFKWESKLEPLRFEIAKQDYLRTREQTSIRVTELFFDLLVAEKNLLLSKFNTANTDTLYQMGEKRLKIASIEKLDLYILKLDLLNQQTQQTVAENNYDRAKGSLISFLGFPPDQPIILVAPGEPPVSIIPEQIALDNAKKSSSFFTDLSRQLIEAQSEVERLRRESFQANLDISLGVNNAEPHFEETYRDFNRQQRLNLTLQIPIIDWGRRKGLYKLSERRLEGVNAEVSQSRIDMEMNIIMSVREYNLQSRLLEGAKMSEDIASETYEIAKRRFLIGRGDASTIAIHLTRRDDAAINYLQALRRFWTLYYTIRRDTLFDFEKDITLTADFDTWHHL